MSSRTTFQTNLTPLASEPIPESIPEPIIENWLATKRSPQTQEVYRRDIRNFLADAGLTLGDFLNCDHKQGHEIVDCYRGRMISRKLTPATINRRLAAIKSLIVHAYACGHCTFTLEAIRGEKEERYRDTTGIDLDKFKDVLNGIDQSDITGVRDYALLSLLWSNALRRSEVANTNLKDFDPENKTLRIFGKGKGVQSETVSLGQSTVTAILFYLKLRGEVKPDEPLFVAHKSGYVGHRLHVATIYRIVRQRCEAVGIKKLMSPHRIRHSAITTALDKTNGDVRRVQKLSRHANLNTLMIYDDNRVNAQKDMTDLLDSLI